MKNKYETYRSGDEVREFIRWAAAGTLKAGLLGLIGILGYIASQKYHEEKTINNKTEIRCICDCVDQEYDNLYRCLCENPEEPSQKYDIRIEW